MASYKKTKFVYKPWVEKVLENSNFPFSFSVTQITDNDINEFTKNNKIDIELDFTKNDNLLSLLKQELIRIFPFYEYANEYSKDYKKTKDLKYFAKLNFYTITKELTTSKKEKKVKALNKQWIVEINNIELHYSYSLVETIEDLKALLAANEGSKVKLAYDCETTGTNPDDDHLVGISLAFSNTKGYYIAINHAPKFKEYNLGIEAVEIIYDFLKTAYRIYMFNARFDMRFLEFTNKKFDTSRLKVVDAQVNVYLVDPDHRIFSLKDDEKYYLGFYRPDLSGTIGKENLASSGFKAVDPRKGLFYAAQDGISTFALGEETMPFLEENGISGQIDQTLLFPLMRMENRGIIIDVDYLEHELEYITTRLAELDELIKSQIGDINLNSPKQKQALFESFNLDTKEVTMTGQMSTKNDHIDAMIERMENNNEEIPEWLKYFGERSKLDKLNSTFFGSLVEQAKLYPENRVRLNYRNTQAATGRLSSGSELSD